MKFGAAILTVAFLALPAFAAERVEVLTLPPSVFADTEVSTNIVVNRRRNDVKAFDVSMELAGSVSNSVQIAFVRGRRPQPPVRPLLHAQRRRADGGI